MGAATVTGGFVCTWPTVWPDPGLFARGIPESSTCWTVFATREERAAHYADAHAAYLAERGGVPVRVTDGAADVEPEEVAAPEPLPDPSTWRCAQPGCTAPLSAHPLERARLFALSLGD